MGISPLPSAFAVVRKSNSKQVLGWIKHSVFALLTLVLLYVAFLFSVYSLLKSTSLTDQGVVYIKKVLSKGVLKSQYDFLVLKFLDHPKNDEERVLSKYYAPFNVYLVRDKNYLGNYIYGVIGIVKNTSDLSGDKKGVDILTRGGNTISLVYDPNVSMVINSDVAINTNSLSGSYIVEIDPGWLVEARFRSAKDFSDMKSTIGKNGDFVIDIMFKL